MAWFLYLLECADGSIYTGIATDVQARFDKHASGEGARYTRSRKPVRVLASFELADRSGASKAEYWVKRLAAGDKRALAAGVRTLGSVLPEVNAEPEAVPMVEAVPMSDAKAKSAAKPAPGAKAKAVAKPAPDSKAKPNSKAKPVAKPTANAKAKSAAMPTPDAKAKSMAKPLPKANPTPKANQNPRVPEEARAQASAS